MPGGVGAKAMAGLHRSAYSLDRHHLRPGEGTGPGKLRGEARWVLGNRGSVHAFGGAGEVGSSGRLCSGRDGGFQKWS